MNGYEIICCKDRFEFNEVQRLCFSVGIFWASKQNYCKNRFNETWIRKGPDSLIAYGSAEQYKSLSYDHFNNSLYSYISFKTFERRIKLKKLYEK